MAANWGVIGAGAGTAVSPFSGFGTVAGYNAGQNYKNNGVSFNPDMPMKNPGDPVSPYESMYASLGTAQGPSAQAQYLMANQQNMLGQNMGQLDRDARTSVQGGLNALARRGGYQGGSGMQLMKTAGQNALAGKQSLYSGLANMQNQTLAADESNKQNILANLMNQANQRYGFNMEALAAQKAAEAQMKIAQHTGGLLGSGGMFGSGLSMPSFGF